MLNPKKLEQIMQQFQDSLPQGIKDLGQDAEAKIKQTLQTQVLIRTREKLVELEKRVDELLAKDKN